MKYLECNHQLSLVFKKKNSFITLALTTHGFVLRQCFCFAIEKKDEIVHKKKLWWKYMSSDINVTAIMQY